MATIYKHGGCVAVYEWRDDLIVPHPNVQYMLCGDGTWLRNFHKGGWKLCRRPFHDVERSVKEGRLVQVK